MTSRVVHFEVPIDDADRAGAFYRDVFGWNVAKWGPVDYWTMTTGAEPGPGAEGALTPGPRRLRESWCTSVSRTSTWP